jgi:hypothetical protein
MQSAQRSLFFPSAAAAAFGKLRSRLERHRLCMHNLRIMLVIFGIHLMAALGQAAIHCDMLSMLLLLSGYFTAVRHCCAMLFGLAASCWAALHDWPSDTVSPASCAGGGGVVLTFIMMRACSVFFCDSKLHIAQLIRYNSSASVRSLA